MLIFRNSLFDSKTLCPLISQFSTTIKWRDVYFSRTDCSICVKPFTTSVPNLIKYSSDNEWTDKTFSDRLVQGLKQPKIILGGLYNFAGEFGKLYEEKKQDFFLNTKQFQYRDPDNTLDMLFTFDKEDELEKFMVATDAAHYGGYSSASLKMTPAKTALFTGNVCSELLKDGEAKFSGYATMLTRKAFKENVYTIPNVLCVTRIALSPFLSYLIVFNHFEFALIFMIVAGISDLVDGWIARNYKNQSSKIGTFLDPLADKVLIGTLFLSLTYIDLIPVALTALIIGRDVVLITSGFVIRYKSLPPPRTMGRYFDVSHATAELAPTLISKINTGIQLALVATTLIAPIMGYANHQFLHTMWYVTAASTVAAAASYIFSKETYKYLKKTK